MSRGQDLIQKIIEKNIGENGENFSEFLTEIGYTDQNKTTFWKDLIKDLQADQGATNVVPSTNHPYPIREVDTLVENSLVNIITHLCDLSTEEDEEETKKIILSNLYLLLKEDENTDFWNESVQELIGMIEELKNPESNPTLIHIDNQTDLKLNDFKEADAGANYNDITKEEIVEPFVNIDNDTYNKVRGADKVHRIAQYLDRIDFTNNHSDWITLMMPTYSRGTKIEDLNRNFWVIAEAIDGISSWVMDGSPLQQILNKFINEIAQLWENCLYLWMQISLMNQKKSENIFAISEPIKATDYEHLTHYDNIPEINCKIEGKFFTISEEKIYNHEDEEKLEVERLRYYSELYSQSVFGLLPIYRVNNYRYNYYSGQYYKSFYVWNPNKIDTNDQFSYRIYEIVEVLEDGNDMIERPIIISPRYDINTRFINKIYATRFDEKSCKYIYPFSKIDKVVYEEPVLLYGCLKVIPEIKFNLAEDDGIDVEIFNLKIYDAAAPIINGTDRLIGYFNFLEVDNDNNKIKLQYITNSFNQEEDLEVKEKYFSETSKSYYLGDVASWKNRIPIKWD